VSEPVSGGEADDEQGWKWQIIGLTEIDWSLEIYIGMKELFSAGLTEFSLQTENFHPWQYNAWGK